MVALQQAETAADSLKVSAAFTREVEAVLRRYMRYLLERDIRAAFWLDSLRARLGDRVPA